MLVRAVWGLCFANGERVIFGIASLPFLLWPIGWGCRGAPPSAAAAAPQRLIRGWEMEWRGGGLRSFEPGLHPVIEFPDSNPVLRPTALDPDLLPVPLEERFGARPKATWDVIASGVPSRVFDSFGMTSDGGGRQR